MTTIVKLKRAYGLNNADEVCGFNDDEAASLIAAGAAKELSKKEIADLKTAKPSVETRTTKDKPKGAKNK